MDLVSLSFLALMVLLTGAMAYAGDTMGRVLGKKRVKLFGLRPKHTAAVLTAGAGAAGACLAILALMAVAEPVRVWILSGNQARNELFSTRKELDSIQAELAKKTTESAKIEEKLSQGEKKLAQGERKLSEAQTLNKRLESDSTRLQQSIQVQKARVSELTASVKQSQAGLQKVRSELVREQSSAARIRTDNAQVARRNLDLTMANDQLEQQKNQLSTLTASLEKERDGLKDSIDRLTKNFDETSRVQREELLQAQTKLEEANNSLLSAQTDLESIQNDLDRIRREREALVTFGTAARSLPMTFAIRDELMRLPIPRGLTEVEARSLVTGALQKASERAAAKGAGLSLVENAAAGLIDIQRTGQPTLLVEQQRDGLIRQIAGSSEERVLILRAMVNTFQGEFVPLEILLYRNPVVYQPGQVVAELRIDGRENEDSLAAAVANFIERQMTPKVLRDGLIPAQGSPQPLGEISRDMMIRLVQTIRSRMSFVRVQFVAAAEVRAGDPLKLDFRLR